MEKIKSLMKDEKFNNAEELIKKELLNDSSNPFLHYYLFICSNNGYLGADYNNIRNEIEFNRALELAKEKDRKYFETEYYIFKNLDSDLKVVFYQAINKNKDYFLDLTSKDFKKYSLSFELVTELEKYLHFLNDDDSINFYILFLNIVYILTRDNSLKEVLEYAKLKGKNRNLYFGKNDIATTIYELNNQISDLYRVVKKDTNVIIIEDEPKEKTIDYLKSPIFLLIILFVISIIAAQNKVTFLIPLMFLLMALVLGYSIKNLVYLYEKKNKVSIILISVILLSIIIVIGFILSMIG